MPDHRTQRPTLLIQVDRLIEWGPVDAVIASQSAGLVVGDQRLNLHPGTGAAGRSAAPGRSDPRILEPRVTRDLIAWTQRLALESANARRCATGSCAPPAAWPSRPPRDPAPTTPPAPEPSTCPEPDVGPITVRDRRRPDRSAGRPGWGDVDGHRRRARRALGRQRARTGGMAAHRGRMCRGSPTGRYRFVEMRDLP